MITQADADRHHHRQQHGGPRWKGSMHALRAGALEVVSKPPGPRPRRPSDGRCSQSSSPPSRAMAAVKVVPALAATDRFPSRCGARNSAHRCRGPGGRHRLLDRRAGGPSRRSSALLARRLPPPLFLVAQHITPGFTTGLAAWLNAECDPPCQNWPSTASRSWPHTVYLAPDDRHLGVNARGHRPSSPAPRRLAGFRPSGTFLFEAAARCLRLPDRWPSS